MNRRRPRASSARSRPPAACVAAQHRVDVAVEPRRRVRQRLLVGRDGLADVREHARHVLAAARVDRLPTPPARRRCPWGRRRPAGRRGAAARRRSPRSRDGGPGPPDAPPACGWCHAPRHPRAGRAPAPTGCPCGRPRTARWPWPAPTMGIARREPVPTPWLTGRPSWNCLAGSWQVAHDTAPLRLSRASLKRRRPSVDGGGLPLHRVRRVRRHRRQPLQAQRGQHGPLFGAPAHRARRRLRLAGVGQRDGQRRAQGSGGAAEHPDHRVEVCASSSPRVVDRSGSGFSGPRRARRRRC